MCHVIVDIKENKIKMKVFFIAALSIWCKKVRIEKYIRNTHYHMFCAKTCVAHKPNAVVSIMMFITLLPK